MPEDLLKQYEGRARGMRLKMLGSPAVPSNTAGSRLSPASAVLPLPAASMQHGVREQAPPHASPAHRATSTAAPSHLAT